ncbi:MAG: uncharacterized protein QG623_686 [Patescibacteria group bacterium]|nr:uncharacterized protein [Patescibacteria group bacterium]
MKNKKTLFALLSLILGLSLFGAGQSQTFALDVPKAPNSGYVLDSANILSEEDDLSLNNQIQALRDESTNEIGIFTSPDLEGEDPAQFSVEVGRAWGIGTKDYNNGVVIIVSLTNPKRIFIGTGTGLEGALPDALAGQISRDEIAPKFKEDRYFDGLSAGVSAISLATKGEYKAPEKKFKPNGDFVIGAIVMAFVVIQVIASIMASSKSWWLGGILGLIFSSIIAAITTSILVFALTGFVLIPLGLISDYFLSKNYKKHAEKKKHDSNYIMPWYLGGGGSSSGSGGGFGGGGFSGGGGFGGGGGGSSW